PRRVMAAEQRVGLLACDGPFAGRFGEMEKPEIEWFERKFGGWRLYKAGVALPAFGLVADMVGMGCARPCRGAAIEPLLGMKPASLLGHGFCRRRNTARLAQVKGEAGDGVLV